MKIFIIGGMGALASSWIHSTIIKHISELGVHKDSDYPEILHHSLNIDDNNYDGNFHHDWLLTSALIELFKPDVIVSCCVSISDKIKSLGITIIDPLILLQDIHDSTILASKYSSDNYTINNNTIIPGIGIDNLAQGINTIHEINEELHDIINPVFGCTEYGLVYDNFPTIPNVSMMIVNEVIKEWLKILQEN